MDIEIKNNEILKIPLGALSVSGFIQFDDQKFKLLQKLWGYFVIVSYMWYSFSFVVFLYINNFKVDLVFNNGSAMSMYFTIWTKGLVSVIYKDKYISLFKRVNESMKTVENDGDEGMKDILHEMVKKSKSIAWLMQSMTTFTSSVFAIYLCCLTFVLYV